jgi:hypothetical protein
MNQSAGAQTFGLLTFLVKQKEEEKNVRLGFYHLSLQPPLLKQEGN